MSNAVSIYLTVEVSPGVAGMIGRFSLRLILPVYKRHRDIP